MAVRKSTVWGVGFDRRAFRGLAPRFMWPLDHAAAAGTVVVFWHSHPSVHCITPGIVRLGTL